MRFSLGLPTDRVDAPGEFLTAGAVSEMARDVEAAGFDACFVTEHPFPGDKWLAHGGHHALDPFVALSFAAAATTRLRLQTNMLVAPYRNPFLTAKAVASLDALSDGRVILGVAAGYLRPEFEALGMPFDERNDLTDEALRAMRAAWSGQSVTMAGLHFTAPGNTMAPRPSQVGGPPVWVGGNSLRAIRRAVELGSGWVPFPTPPGVARASRTAPIESVPDLEARIGRLRTYAAEVGRTDPLDICFVPFGWNMMEGAGIDRGAFADTVDELDAVGVTWLTLSIPAPDRATFLRGVGECAELLSTRQS